MTTSLDHLLPAPDETLRCADHTRRIEVDPGGTAIQAERVVLVATPLPWPKPALDHPRLRSLADAFRAASAPTRVLAHVPAGADLDTDGHDPGAGAGDGAGVTVGVFERAGGSATERWYHAPSADQALELARALAAGDPDRARAHLRAEHVPARPSLLVCTQGSHDVCCGAEGTRLAAELEAWSDATLAADGGTGRYRVYRVSHTGGHRFAPTAMTLPDGRMWAGLTTALVDQILTRTGSPDELARRCRGWWGAEEGMAQVAERAVFAHRGWDLDDHDRTIGLTPAPGGASTAAGRAVVTVLPLGPDGDTEGERWEVEVVEGRAVPTIACRQPGGLPAKPGREYEVVSIRPITAAAGAGLPGA